MKTHILMALVVLWSLLLYSGAFGALRDGVKLEADGEVIDVRVGHLVPCTADWNNDGKKDLIVGQFDGGRIRLYLNHGTDSNPEFNDFSYLQAGGKEISLPAG